MIATAANAVAGSAGSPQRASRRQAILAMLAAVLVVTLTVAFATGAVPLSLREFLWPQDGSQLARTVFVEIRSPRVVLAAVTGAALALAGASLQGLFRNPLADPTLIGVSSGAALGAIAMIVLGSALALPEWFSPYAVPLSAVASATLVTLFLYAFASRYGRFSIVTMLLVGIAINALATVGIGAFEYLSDDTQLRTLVFWMMGSFGKATWPMALPAIALIAVASAVLLSDARRLDLLQLGEAEARHVGVHVSRLKRRTILGTAAAVGAGVALSGVIAFVGLVVPHLVRLLGGAGHRYVLPGSLLLGASLTVGADLVARIVIVPAEIPVGLVTSALGAPFFLWLIARVRPH